MLGVDKEFPYQVRVSPRARRVKLAFNPYRGLEVVIPRRFPRREIPRILQQHAEWISGQYQRHADKLQGVEPPRQITLTLSGESLAVRYLQTGKPEIKTAEGEILIHTRSDAQSIALLRRWLRQTANGLLKPMLQQVAEELGLAYTACSVRGQKSRWGSCSSRGRISLNEQLLFMPSATVRYLMIHELCHTRYLNHSVDFWRLVASFEPDFRRYEKALDQGRQAIPGWYLQDLYSNGR